MKSIDDLMKMVKDSVVQHTSQAGGGFDSSPLLQRIEELFAQHKSMQRQPGPTGRNVRPASEDPFGDPADEPKGRIKPASEDPYGDPAGGQH